MRRVKDSEFLKDVFLCTLGAYGGPEVHIGVFIDHLVIKKKYLREDELIELLALSTILPGPTSTQTIVAIGYKLGGIKLATLTMLVWALPATLFMILLGILYRYLEIYNISSEFFRFIPPMATAFIFLAAFRIGKKVATDKLTVSILAVSTLITYFYNSPWIFPILLLGGGVISSYILLKKKKVEIKEEHRKIKKEKPSLFKRLKLGDTIQYFWVFLILALIAGILAQTTTNKLLVLFESFYRYGYSVFGGGQVIVPLMFREIVNIQGYMSGEEFLTGYGLVQGVPGPMFSFSAFVGSMALKDSGILMQSIGGVLASIGIFLPGILLIYFIYPVWRDLKKLKVIKGALRGINAVAGGLLINSSIHLIEKTNFNIENTLVIFLTGALLVYKKIPVPLIVISIVIAGILIK